jgi:hypothetical protein
MYAIDNPGAAGRAVAVGHALLVVLLLLATNAMGQGETNTRPAPQPTPFVPSEPRPWPEPKPNLPGKQSLPPSSVVEIKSSLTELRENVALMQAMNDDLQRAVSSTSSPDYVVVATNAIDIRRLAIRLMRNLALPRNGPQASPATPRSGGSADELKAAVLALDTTIQEFLRDPVLTHSRTVDAGELGNAGANLETVMSRSAIVQKEAEMLATNSGKAVKATRRIKSRLAPSTSIQLTLECSAWSMSDLLKRPSQIKGHDSVKIGANVKTRRHKLDEQLLLPIDDCVDGETYEKAVTDKVQYVAIVTDFTSYEVKGRVFGYRVSYEIGFTRSAQIAKRFRQPVSFYYVDEAGDGSFELLKGPLSFGLLPDWAAELARKH